MQILCKNFDANGAMYIHNLSAALPYFVVDYCDGVLCGLHGWCESLPALQRHQCHCVPGWLGPDCDRQACVNGDSCFNGGTCG